VRAHLSLGSSVVRIALPALVGFVLFRFGYELWRMLNAPSPLGGNDLYSRYGETHRWFADLLVYTHSRHAGYPPASYALLWPLLGWLPWTLARWLWTGLNLGVLGLLMRSMVRQSGAGTRGQQVLLVLVLLAAYPLPVTLGNGQLGILTLTAMLAGVFLLERGGAPRWRRDLVVAALLVFALLKPSLTAPFLLLVVFRPRRLRPTVFVVLGYAALTWLAMAFRSRTLFVEFAALVDVSSQVVVRTGHAHLPLWLATLGLGAWNGLASLLVLLGLAFWVARNRSAGLWPMLAVIAIVGRLASYHGVYDDSLILLAIVALFRIARDAARSGERDVVAELVLLLVCVPLLLPVTMATRGLPWSLVHHVLAPITWLMAAAYLARHCSREKVRTMLPA